MQVALKHLLLDFLSSAFFFIVVALTGNVTLAIASGLCVGLAQIAVQKYLGVPVAPIQLMALALVVVLGGAALIAMLKPSISRSAIGAVMLRRGWLGRYLPKITTDTLPAFVIDRTGYAWAALMFGLAALNLIVAASFSVQGWALYAMIVPSAVKAIGFVVTYLVLRAMVDRRLGPAPST